MIDDDMMEGIVDLALSRYPEADRIDWHDLLYRIEVHFEIDLPSDMTAPEIKKIKSAVRAARRETARDT